MDPNSLDYQALLLCEDEILTAGEDLWWRCGPRARLEHGQVHWLINCSDQFYWGTADAERIETLEDIAAIRQAYADLTAADLSVLGKDTFNSVYAGSLWVCRKREMRPQKPWVDKYCPDVDKHIHVRALFCAWDPKPHQGWRQS